MHDAPSVDHPVGRSLWYLRIGVPVACAGGVATAAWWWLAPPGWRQLVASSVWLALAIHAFVSWRQMPAGRLRWDGSHWELTMAGVTRPVGALHAALDLQSVLLVRWTPLQRGRGGWLWLESWRAPARWGDVRRAVYSRATHDALRKPDEGVRADVFS